MADVKENQLTDSANITKVRGIDSNGNSIQSTVDQLTDNMRKVSADRDGLMSKSLFNSIFYNTVSIPAGGTYNTEVINGGIIMIQNQSAEHRIALALLYADGNGQILCPSISVGFLDDNTKAISIIKSGPNEPILVKNNNIREQYVSIRIIQNKF